MMAMVELYDMETDQFKLMPARQALKDTLGELSGQTLNKIRVALVEEPYICVGDWANCSIEEGKPVGCLFAAAYMHTDTFLQDLAFHNGKMRETMRAFEEDGTYHAANSLDESENDVSRVIEAFDAWGAQKSKHRVIEYQFKDVYGNLVDSSERVLTKGARTEIITMIDNILAGR